MIASFKERNRNGNFQFSDKSSNTIYFQFKIYKLCGKNQILSSVKEKMETKYSLIKCWLPGFDYTYAFINTMISWDIYLHVIDIYKRYKIFFYELRKVRGNIL